MIQEMMSGYGMELLVGWVKAGIIGWIVWFIAAFTYLLMSFGLNLELYHVDKEKGEKKWTLRGILEIVFWPAGMLKMTHELVKHVNSRLKGENRK